jgi:hypothetical protein
MSHRWSAITGAFAARDKLNASISRTGIHENNKKYKPVPEPEVPEPAPTLSHVATGQGQSSAYYNTSHWTPTVANAPGYHYHSAQQAWPPRNQGYGTLQPMTLPGYDTTQQLQSSPQQSYSSPQPNNSSTQPNYGSLQSQGSPQQTHAFSAPGNGNANAYQNNQALSYNGYPPSVYTGVLWKLPVFAVEQSKSGPTSPLHDTSAKRHVRLFLPAAFPATS